MKTTNVDYASAITTITIPTQIQISVSLLMCIKSCRSLDPHMTLY